MSLLPDHAPATLTAPDEVASPPEKPLTSVCPDAASSVPLGVLPETKTTPGQLVWIALGIMAFLYFARPVVLPIFLACVAGMTLKPLIRWLSECHIRPALSAAVVLCLFVAVVVIGFLNHAT